MIAAFTPAAETIAAWVVIICVAAWMVTNRLVGILTWIDRRAQVEWDAEIEQAIRLTQEDDLAWTSWAELEFAASVQADIDELPGGAA